MGETLLSRQDANRAFLRLAAIAARDAAGLRFVESVRVFAEQWLDEIRALRDEKEEEVEVLSEMIARFGSIEEMVSGG